MWNLQIWPEVKGICENMLALESFNTISNFFGTKQINPFIILLHDTLKESVAPLIFSSFPLSLPHFNTAITTPITATLTALFTTSSLLWPFSPSLYIYKLAIKKFPRLIWMKNWSCLIAFKLGRPPYHHWCFWKTWVASFFSDIVSGSFKSLTNR